MRRQEILGPLVTRDTLTDEVLATATRRQGPPNHWSEAWLDAIQGTAYSSAGKTSQAAALLKRSMLMLGQYDHAVTGLALLQLGQIALNTGDYKTASGYFEEASYSGYDFGDSTVIEQAFSKLFLTHVLTGDTQILETPFASAAAWAKAKNREIQARIGNGAESLAMRGARQQAASVLAEATGVNRTPHDGTMRNWIGTAIRHRDDAICGPRDPGGRYRINCGFAVVQKWRLVVAISNFVD